MPHHDEFDERTVVITGGGSGIGRETAEQFGEAGANVVVADVDEDGAAATASTIDAETDGDAIAVHTDVTDDASVADMVAATRENYDGLDVAFNNAGIGGTFAAVDDIAADEWARIIDVNLSGVWRCMKHEIPAMREDGGGAIINTASILGQVAEAGTPAYTASKHGVVGLTRVAALDYATENIRVNAVCPGYIETQMLEDAGVTSDDEMRKQTEALHPMGRLGRPEEIADAVLWLASDGASFATGETLTVDGGYLSR